MLAICLGVAGHCFQDSKNLFQHIATPEKKRVKKKDAARPLPGSVSCRYYRELVRIRQRAGHGLLRGVYIDEANALAVTVRTPVIPREGGNLCQGKDRPSASRRRQKIVISPRCQKMANLTAGSPFLRWSQRPLEANDVPEDTPHSLASSIMDKGFFTYLKHMGEPVEVIHLAWLIEGGPSRVLVDTGYASADFRKYAFASSDWKDIETIETALPARGYRLADIRTIVITHFDNDHILNAGKFPMPVSCATAELEFAAPAAPLFASKFHPEISRDWTTKPWTGQDIDRGSGHGVYSRPHTGNAVGGGEHG